MAYDHTNAITYNLIPDAIPGVKGGLLWTLSSAAPAPGFVPAVVNVKLYLDVAVYFSALGGTVVLGLLALRWPALARALHLRLGAVLLPRALLAAHLDACSQADADHANEEREADAEVEDEAAAARGGGGGGGAGSGRAGGALAACCGARARRSAAHWLGVPPTLAAAVRRLLSVPREALATVRDLSVGETLVGAEVLALYAFWLWFWSTGYPRIRLEVASAPASACACACACAARALHCVPLRRP